MILLIMGFEVGFLVEENQIRNHHFRLIRLRSILLLGGFRLQSSFDIDELPFQKRFFAPIR